jgi:hypothetical protein
MLNALFEFVIGFIIGRTARNTALAARNTALAAERAAWTETMKADYQIERAAREKYLAGQRRFVFTVFGVMIAALWAVSALFGGH